MGDVPFAELVSRCSSMVIVLFVVFNLFDLHQKAWRKLMQKLGFDFERLPQNKSVDIIDPNACTQARQHIKKEILRRDTLALGGSLDDEPDRESSERSNLLVKETSGSSA